MSHEYPNSLDLCHWSITHVQKICSFYCSETMAAAAPLGKAWSLTRYGSRYTEMKSSNVFIMGCEGWTVMGYYNTRMKSRRGVSCHIQGHKGNVPPMGESYDSLHGWVRKKKSKFFQFLRTLNMPKYHVWGSCVLIPSQTVASGTQSSAKPCPN